MNNRLSSMIKRGRLRPIALRIYKLLHSIREPFALLHAQTIAKGISRHGWRYRATISFSPDPPKQFSVIKRYCYLNRYRVVPANAPSDIRVFWAYGADEREISAGYHSAINSSCQNISKSFVDQIHQEVFGYNLAVDPYTFVGKAYAKSEENAVHDGRIVTLPIKQPNPELVYQVLVDNLLQDDIRQDLRILIIAGRIVHITLVHRRQLENGMISGRILGTTRLVPTEEILSDWEIECVLGLTQRLGLDYGEVDALRDRPSGRLFVVDVNRAVGGLPTPKEMETLDSYWHQLELGASAFDSAFLLKNRDSVKTSLQKGHR